MKTPPSPIPAPSFVGWRKQALHWFLPSTLLAIDCSGPIQHTQPPTPVVEASDLQTRLGGPVSLHTIGTRWAIALHQDRQPQPPAEGQFSLLTQHTHCVHALLSCALAPSPDRPPHTIACPASPAQLDAALARTLETLHISRPEQDELRARVLQIGTSLLTR